MNQGNNDILICLRKLIFDFRKKNALNPTHLIIGENLYVDLKKSIAHKTCWNIDEKNQEITFMGLIVRHCKSGDHISVE